MEEAYFQNKAEIIWANVLRYYEGHAVTPMLEHEMVSTTSVLLRQDLPELGRMNVRVNFDPVHFSPTLVVSVRGEDLDNWMHTGEHWVHFAFR